MVEYENEKNKIIEEITKLYADLIVADKAVDDAEALVAQYMAFFNDEESNPIETMTELAAKITKGENTAEELKTFNELAATLTNKVTALNRYEENVVIKKEALNVVKTKLSTKLAEVAELFSVDQKVLEKTLGKTGITFASITEVEDFEKLKDLFTAEKYVGYGSFDAEGNYTPRAEDFIGENGEYNVTTYTMSDNSVVRCGWDKDGDGKTDVVIYINYNTFDVYVYENGKAITIPAMGYVVL